MKTSKKKGIENLSRHLFWDLDMDKLDIDEDKKLIIHRVLDYGIMSDWQFILNHYGMDEITEIASSTRDLNIKSASFVSLLADIPKDKFLCYASRQLTSKHWTS